MKKTISPKLRVVGKDAIAVEAVGAYLVGLQPNEMPLLKEARNRGLGEIEIDKINIIGDIETPRNRIIEAFESLFP